MEFIASQRDGCTHTAIAQGLSIPKSSLTALLQDLLSKGYLQRSPESGIFTIGVQVLWLSNSYLRNLNLVKLGQPLVAEVFTKVKEFSILAIPNGLEYVTICTESVPSIFGHSLQLGSRGPLYGSALGRAMLAFMPDAQVDEVLRSSKREKLTPFTKTSLAEIKAELAETRRTGVSFVSEESVPGVVGYATPVFGAMGVPVAAFGVGVSTGSFKKKAEAEIVAALKDASRQLSQQLGSRWPMAA